MNSGSNAKAKSCGSDTKKYKKSQNRAPNRPKTAHQTAPNRAPNRSKTAHQTALKPRNDSPQKRVTKHVITVDKQRNLVYSIK